MVPMELYGTGPPRGMQSLTALIKISPAILTKGCVGKKKKRLCWQVHKVFDHTNITTHADHPIIWHGSGLSPPFPQLDQGRGQGEIWKLALSFRKFQIWEGHYSDKTNHSLTFNSSTNWTFCIQACVRDPYVLLKGTISINESVQELSCQDYKLYTCLNSSLYNPNHSFVTLRRRLGIQHLVNETRPWERSPEIHTLVKVIKKVLQCSKRFIGLLTAAIVGIIATATTTAVAGGALHQTIQTTTSVQ